MLKAFLVVQCKINIIHKHPPPPIQAEVDKGSLKSNGDEASSYETL